MNAVEEVARFINERELIRRKKESGQPKPWTDDPIFQTYKFCNVRREDDTVTRWLTEHWLEPYEDHPNLWFACCLARQINWPETLAEIGFPVVWKPETVRSVMLCHAAKGNKIWGNAYMLRGNVQKGGDKPRYMVDNMTVLWQAQNKPREDDTLASYHARLVQYPGWGSFLAAQAVADLKHTVWLVGATDWWTWAAWGPGSNRGLNRYYGLPLKHIYKQEEFLDRLHKVALPVASLLDEEIRPLCAQNWQNVMCEWDKYERTRLGEGRPKQNYPGI